MSASSTQRLVLVMCSGQENIGVAEVKSNAYPDPNETDQRVVVVDLKAKKKLAHPVSLASRDLAARGAGFRLRL